jgi:hypothetical protein
VAAAATAAPEALVAPLELGWRDHLDHLGTRTQRRLRVALAVLAVLAVLAAQRVQRVQRAVQAAAGLLGAPQAQQARRGPPVRVVAVAAAVAAGSQPLALSPTPALRRRVVLVGQVLQVLPAALLARRGDSEVAPTGFRATEQGVLAVQAAALRRRQAQLARTVRP